MLSDELSETVTFRTTSALELLQNLVREGVRPGTAELLITGEWAIMASENERTTTTVRDLTPHTRGLSRSSSTQPQCLPLTSGGLMLGSMRDSHPRLPGQLGPRWQRADSGRLSASDVPGQPACSVDVFGQRTRY